MKMGNHDVQKIRRVQPELAVVVSFAYYLIQLEYRLSFYLINRYFLNNFLFHVSSQAANNVILSCGTLLKQQNILLWVTLTIKPFWNWAKKGVSSHWKKSTWLHMNWKRQKKCIVPSLIKLYLGLNVFF